MGPESARNLPQTDNRTGANLEYILVQLRHKRPSIADLGARARPLAQVETTHQPCLPGYGQRSCVGLEVDCRLRPFYLISFRIYRACPLDYWKFNILLLRSSCFVRNRTKFKVRRKLSKMLAMPPSIRILYSLCVHIPKWNLPEKQQYNLIRARMAGEEWSWRAKGNKALAILADSAFRDDCLLVGGAHAVP